MVRGFFLFLLPLAGFVGMFIGLVLGHAEFSMGPTVTLLILAVWSLGGGFIHFGLKHRKHPAYR
ncbi:hypothetical protein [Tuberibacillus sp. Marseille-P3662]|uniref:hypothetical protein n=1 Tax=Tuberibacillus sp. Marseille-P3662 TaxID=1965358 RepID=UPI000A1CD54E|nr:hypothetical protein [Tuberibacillus sp. Marseille-P3662]